MMRRTMMALALRRSATGLMHVPRVAPAAAQQDWAVMCVEAQMEVEDWQGNQEYCGHHQNECALETRLLLKAFNRYDADQNLYLDKDELRTMLSEFGLDSTPAAVDAAFAELDTNKDGVVSVLEFCTGASGVGLKDAILNEAARAEA
eukprot:TRINITY_DN6518_c0_g1_i1.p2 TRINITY_DN6518_c0_g1~~TRINITY_DN6518_c0_g1_i1.p2  ORF type:complete len:147 (+),score=53.44 TRINITY_DN6518_c0_g1_i1:100-540(+)